MSITEQMCLDPPETPNAKHLARGLRLMADDEGFRCRPAHFRQAADILDGDACATRGTQLIERRVLDDNARLRSKVLSMSGALADLVVLVECLVSSDATPAALEKARRVLAERP